MKVDLKQAQLLTGELKYRAYSALDATGTREVFDVLHPRLNEDQARTYRWSMAQQSPAFTMTRRGILVDRFAREDAARDVDRELTVAVKGIRAGPLLAGWDGWELETGFCPAYRKTVQTKGKCPIDGKNHKWTTTNPSLCAKCETPRISSVVTKGRHKWSPAKRPDGSTVPLARISCVACNASRTKPKPFEPTSPQQAHHLFYDLLQVPHQTNKKGEISTDKTALEKIGREGTAYFTQSTGRRVRKALPGLVELVAQMLVVRDLQKQQGFLKAELSPSGRFHSSFNVGAAWTGRWSSSQDPFRRGGNAQNIGEKHRHIFIADPGMELFYADLKTAESLVVAHLAGDEAYIEAHKGDVHTWVTRELWPELPWTGDIRADKKIAQSHIPEWDNHPGHDFRFQAKRIQHGSNYGLTAFGIAVHAHIPLYAARRAQRRYFHTFPHIPQWHNWVNEQVVNSRPLYNILRRMVRLFGRPLDPHTRNQALSFSPQGGVGEILNLGLWRVWREHDPSLIWLLAQVHDAILGEWRVEDRERAAREVARLMTIEVPVLDFRGTLRHMTIQVEIAAGQNWGKRNTDPDKGRLNPEGIEEIRL